jgi:hypothetical protein
MKRVPGSGRPHLETSTATTDVTPSTRREQSLPAQLNRPTTRWMTAVSRPDAGALLGVHQYRPRRSGVKARIEGSGGVIGNDYCFRKRCASSSSNHRQNPRVASGAVRLTARARAVGTNQRVQEFTIRPWGGACHQTGDLSRPGNRRRVRATHRDHACAELSLDEANAMNLPPRPSREYASGRGRPAGETQSELGNYAEVCEKTSGPAHHRPASYSLT